MTIIVLVAAMISCLVSGLILTFGISKQLPSQSGKLVAVVIGVVDLLVGLGILIFLISAWCFSLV
jgi:uncharacterized membrane protein